MTHILRIWHSKLTSIYKLRFGKASQKCLQICSFNYYYRTTYEFGSYWRPLLHHATKGPKNILVVLSPYYIITVFVNSIFIARLMSVCPLVILYICPFIYLLRANLDSHFTTTKMQIYPHQSTTDSIGSARPHQLIMW